MDVLALVDDELEIYFDVVQLLHPQQPVVSSVLFVLFDDVPDRLVKDLLDVVYNVLENLVVHFGEDNKLEEGVDCPE